MELRKAYTISYGATKKIRPPRHIAQLSIWKGGLGILDIHTHLNCLKDIWIQRSLNPTSAL